MDFLCSFFFQFGKSILLFYILWMFVMLEIFFIKILGIVFYTNDFLHKSLLDRGFEVTCNNHIPVLII